ncbi:MAG TPA: DUF1330 domain-containing protein [Limnobacter sp.]|nr:DUF1330 domain-containing protein [Limnobacter sp.]
MKAAYVVGQICIKNELAWQQYKSQVPLTLEPFGAELVFRGTHAGDYSGKTKYTNFVVIRFGDLDAANRWFNSSAYQAIVPLREQAADVLLTVYEDQ